MFIAGAGAVPPGPPPIRPAAPPVSGGRPAPAPADRPVPPDPVPSGQDSELWGILTDEERTFFLSRAAMGPLTYGPASVAPAPASGPLGQRVDLRA